MDNDDDQVDEAAHRERMIEMFQKVQIVNPDDGTSRTMDADEAANFFDALAATVASTEGENWDEPRNDLNQQIGDLDIAEFSGHVPIQGYGTYQGELFYFRSRYQHAELSVGTTIPEDRRNEDPLADVISHHRRYSIVQVVPNEDQYGAGWLKPEEVKIIFRVLLLRLTLLTHEENQRLHDERQARYDEFLASMGIDGDPVTMLTEDKNMGSPFGNPM